MRKEYISKSEEDTINFASQFASKLQLGNIIILSGDLGAGKTKFTQGILKYFNLENEISSPTFTIVNEYTDSTIPIYHFDVYRINDVEEMFEIGYEEYFFSEGVSVVEWADLIEEIIPEDAIRINISYGENEGERIYQISGLEEDIWIF